MKILGISCSPRKKGNTDILIEQVLHGATKEGAILIFMSIRDLNISGCDGCYSCAKSGKCHINDDMYTIYRALENVSYLISSNSVGINRGRQFVGHSLVVDPAGNIIAGSGDEECVIWAEVDHKVC